MRARFFAAVLALGLAATGTDARAQNTDDRGYTYLTGRMNEWIREENAYRADASTVAGGKLVGILKPGAEVTLDVYFEAGATYRLKGICDFDCNDLDLKATGYGGESTDYLDNDFPILNFTASQTQWGHVTISMPGCSSSGCHFGLLVLRR